ncbi:hypothetical protein ACFXTN_039535 [Malus domestica]
MLGLCGSIRALDVDLVAQQFEPAGLTFNALLGLKWLSLGGIGMLNLLLGEGDLKVLLGCEYAEIIGLSGSFRKLFCLPREVGELDLTLFCGVTDTFPLFGLGDCFLFSFLFTPVAKTGFCGNAVEENLEKLASLIELIRLTCGFYL